MVSLYVDDLLYTGSSQQLMMEFKQVLMKEFEMTDLGEMNYFLGLEVSQRKSGIFLSQHKYAIEVLRQFCMDQCKAVATPMNTGEKLKEEDGSGATDVGRYRSLVGRLIYLTHTRPDISFAVGLVSRFMHSPTTHHFEAAKRILRYIAGTRDYGIWYTKSDNFVLQGFTDSDWAGAQDDRKSTTGNCFDLGSGLIAWMSKKQSTVALSSTEAEYVAASMAACQGIWLRRLLVDLGHEQKEATKLLCDNVSTIAMTKNPVMHGRTKHIEIKHHFIRDLVGRKEIKLEFCSTEL